MKRILGLIMMAVVAACSSGEPLPPPSYEKPVLEADGSLSGVVGVDGRHWQLVDPDLRRGVFWYSFMNRLTAGCSATFPEHAEWLGEVNLLLERASGHAMRTGIEMEAVRLGRLSPGADRAVTGLTAMSVADVDVPRIVGGWIMSAVGDQVSDEQGWIKGCGLLFEKESLRGLLRNSTQPLAVYYGRMQADHPDIYQEVPGVDATFRRLKKV